jgi:hypothetical protein
MSDKPVRYTADSIESLILNVRGHRVIVAADLAAIYGVATKALNQAVKRNISKFPADFIFQLTIEEANEWRRLRSQSVTLKRGYNIKYLPYAFTEHGAIMAAIFD